METVEYKGFKFEVSIDEDTSAGKPEDNQTLLGSVIYTARKEDAPPGTVLIYESRHNGYVFYNRMLAEINANEEKASIEAVDAEQKMLAGYYADQWYYVQLSVEMVDYDVAEYLGCIESDATDYIKQTQIEMMEQCITEWQKEHFIVTRAESFACRLFNEKDFQDNALDSIYQSACGCATAYAMHPSEVLEACSMIAKIIEKD